MIKFSFLGEKYCFTKSDLKVLNSLVKQLNPNSPLVEKKYLSRLVKNSYWVIARDKITGMIVGMGTLGVMTTLRGLKGHVEDVVVDQTYRGRGLGTKLIEMLIKKAKGLGVKRLELTSKPSRVEANKLYQKLGFELRSTNPYKMDL